MPKSIEIAFLIGGALTTGFNSTMGQAVSQVNKLGAAVKEAEGGKQTIQRFTGLRKGVEKTKNELAAARQKAALLKKEFDSAARPTKKLKNQMAAASKKVYRLSEKLKSQRTSMASLKREMDRSGISTKNLASEQIRLSRAYDKAKKSRASLSRAMAKHKNIQKNRDEQRGRLMDAFALGSAAAAPVVTASRIEDTEIRLSTVINADDEDKAMKEAKISARKLARTGLTSFAEAYNIQYAMNSAGLSAQASRMGAMVVAKVAKITSGMPESVGEVIAMTYNNLGKELAGTTADKMNRIGDILTKVQLKYQIRDFNQLGMSMKEGAAGLANYNVNLAQGATLLGQLNTAGLEGSKAATGLNAVLRNLSKASKEFNTEIVWDENGDKDVIATLEQMKEAMDDIYGDDKDARSDAVQKIFGDEGVKAFTPLINKLEELKQGYKDVNEGSRGLTDKEIKKFLDATSTHAKGFFSNLTIMGDAFGGLFLPSINAVFTPLSAATVKIVNLTEKFPAFTGIIGGAVAGTAALTAATIAGGYAFSFIAGGIQRVKIAYGVLRVATIAQTIAQTGLSAATKIATACQWAWNVALNANPIGLVIAGVAVLIGAGVLLYKKWDSVKSLFSNLWTGVKEKFFNFTDSFKGLSWFDFGKKLVWTFAKGMLSATTFPHKIMWGVLKKVGKLLPGSDAKEGPLSSLTDSGMSLVTTFGAGINKAAPGLKKTTAGIAGIAAAGMIASAPVMAMPEMSMSSMPSMPAMAMPTIAMPDIQGGEIEASLNALSFETQKSNPIEINLTQTISISVGAGADKAVVQNAVAVGMDKSTSKLKKALEEIVHNERRLSYE